MAEHVYVTQAKAMYEKYRPELEYILQCNTGATQLVFTYKDGAYKCDGMYQINMLATSGGMQHVASWVLGIFPGCCGICVSYHARVSPAYMNRGLGTLLQKFRFDLAAWGGYTVMLATDIKKNPYQRKILDKNGWRDVLEFQNRRTTNIVAVSVKEL